jgi:uncharacterized protein
MNEHNNNQEEDNLPEEPEDNRLKESLIITPKISPVTAAVIGLVTGFFLYQIMGSALTGIVLGFDLENAPVNGVRLMTMVGQVLFMLLPALLLTKWVYEDVTTILRVYLPSLKEIGLFIAAIIILTPLLQNYLMIQEYFIRIVAGESAWFESMKSMFDSWNEIVEKTMINLLTPNNIPEGILVVLIVAVVPAICEEVLFRGYIQRSFEFRFSPVLAALITAVFFGFFHLNPYGIIPLISLGFFFGYAAYKSNSIIIPMILHFINNFTAVMVFFYFGDKEYLSSTITDEINIAQTLVMFSVLGVLFIGIIVVINRYYKEKRI